MASATALQDGGRDERRWEAPMGGPCKQIVKGQQLGMARVTQVTQRDLTDILPVTLVITTRHDHPF